VAALFATNAIVVNPLGPQTDVVNFAEGLNRPAQSSLIAPRTATVDAQTVSPATTAHFDAARNEADS